MKKETTNWSIIEKIAKSVYPDEYAMVSDRQREHIEQRISEGLYPVERDGEYGGMHCDFANAVEGFGMLMTILSMIVTWYTYTHPKPQQFDWDGFVDYLENNPEELKRFKEQIDTKTRIRVKQNFTTILYIMQNSDKQR